MVIMCAGLSSTSLPYLAGLLPSCHAPTGTPIARTAFAEAVVRDEKLARIPVEGLEWHPGRREEVLANRNQAPRRGWERAARETGGDPLLHAVQRLGGHPFLPMLGANTHMR